MKTVTIECKRYSEWSDEVRERILEKHRDINVDYNWWDCTCDDAKTIGALMGTEIKDIFFSGFCSQGDGAQFTGSYSYAKGGLAKVKEYAPLDEELHRIAAELQTLQRKHFYQLSATVRSSGRYSHEYCTDITVYDAHSGEAWDHADAETDEAVSDLLRDFMRWIYRQLEAEYEYLTSAEVVAETLAANEYEFDASGDIH